MFAGLISPWMTPWEWSQARDVTRESASMSQSWMPQTGSSAAVFWMELAIMEPNGRLSISSCIVPSVMASMADARLTSRHARSRMTLGYASSQP